MTQNLDNYGPLKFLIGNWKGDKGRDRAPAPDRKEENNQFREEMQFVPIGIVNNHEQAIYALRYKTTAYENGHNEPFHEEVGYWLWDKKNKQVMRCFTIPRGITVMAGGTVSESSKSFELSSKLGDHTYGICSNKFLDEEFKTVGFYFKLDQINEKSFSYEEDSQILIKKTEEVFHHIDKNTMKKEETLKQVSENELPIVSDTKPIRVELKKDKKYSWCSCGVAQTQPFCDNSHIGTAFVSKKFTVDQDVEAQLCMCKHTKNPPYCDGSHRAVTKDINSKKAPAGINTLEEPNIQYIHELASIPPKDSNHAGAMTAMGVPSSKLPKWDDIQILTAQLYKKPLLDDVPVDTKVIIGKFAKKPLELDIPLLVSDMSFGSLSEEAKISLAKGAQMAGTGICSGEGGMLPEEQMSNDKYFYELAPAKFGFEENLLTNVQAFHFKAGQSAKTGIGGHLPGQKVTGRVAKVRALEEGKDAISPSTFIDLKSEHDFLEIAQRVRKITDGVPIGFKISAQHLEEDIEFAVNASADYIILDGRGGGTGAAPQILRDHISIPTIPALARARQYLDTKGYDHVSLIITGGLRTPSDFIKALALGADAIAVSNSAIQAIGCIGARICNTNRCPSGVATQDPELRKRINIEDASVKLFNFFKSSNELIKTVARTCGHNEIAQLSITDLTTWKKPISELTDIKFSGVKHNIN